MIVISRKMKVVTTLKMRCSLVFCAYLQRKASKLEQIVLEIRVRAVRWNVTPNAC